MSDPLKELQEELRILESMILRCPMNAEEDERVRLAMIRMDEVIREMERIEGLSPADEPAQKLPELPPLTPPSDDPPTRPGTPEPSPQEFCGECGALKRKDTQHGCGIGRFRGGNTYDSSSSRHHGHHIFTAADAITTHASASTPAHKAKRKLFEHKESPHPHAPSQKKAYSNGEGRKAECRNGGCSNCRRRVGNREYA